MNRDLTATILGKKMSNMRGGMLKPSVFTENSPEAIQGTIEALIVKGYSRNEAEKLMADKEEIQIECWTNSLYQVLVYRGEEADEMVHVPDMKGKCTWLSIKLRSKAPMKGPLDWQAMQDMKNNLCGIDCDAVQIFPKREFLVNTANQYHLIVFPPEFTIPFGWKFSAVDDGSTQGSKDILRIKGAKQNFTSTTERASRKGMTKNKFSKKRGNAA